MRFCQAPSCNNPVFSTCKISKKGYCRNHQYLKESFDRRSIIQRAVDKHKEKNGIRIMNNQEIEAFREEEGQKFKTAIQAKKEMDAFWKYAELVIAKKPYCWECGDYISKSDYRAATAHIFAKSIFESVASNKWNFLVLGARCGCHEKSHRLDLFSQMKVFPTAINRYTKFGDLITETHKYKDLFIDYANKKQ